MSMYSSRSNRFEPASPSDRGSELVRSIKDVPNILELASEKGQGIIDALVKAECLPESFGADWTTRLAEGRGDFAYGATGLQVLIGPYTSDGTGGFGGPIDLRSNQYAVYAQLEIEFNLYILSETDGRIAVTTEKFLGIS